MSYNTSLFGQILKVIPATVFARAVRDTKAERHCKGFSCWSQAVGMLFCQFAQAKSVREVCDGLRVTCGKLNHLGLRSAPCKSTLAYANAHRSWQLYANLFGSLLDLCQNESPGRKGKFRFKNPLFSLDATTIDLCLSLFPWAKFRQTKGAVKLHLLLDHDGYLPTFAVVTEGNVHEVNVAWDISLPKGSIVAMDRGYCDYALFEKWTQQGVYFVTRLKDNAAYEVVEERTLPQRRPIRSDQVIRFTGTKAQKNCPSHMRRVLKQHLKIKTFVGTTENALKTQIWTALITILLIRYLQFRSKCGWALCRLVALLRLNLFSYRNLWDWLNDPFDVPPEEPPYQMELEI